MNDSPDVGSTQPTDSPPQSGVRPRDYAVKRCSLISTYGHNDVWAVFSFDGQLHHVDIDAGECIGWIFDDMEGQ